MVTTSASKKLIFTLIGLTLFGCSSGSKKRDGKNPVVAYYALSIIQPTKGNKVSGTVLFSEGFGKVKVEVNLSGLDPNSKHGFHIHEYGDCSATDGGSAGGHYNPEINTHGAPETEPHHAGDLGNLVTDANGNAKATLEIKDISINSGMNPILGRAVIVHKNSDDLVSQPTGGAGARIGCGVIGATTR